MAEARDPFTGSPLYVSQSVCPPCPQCESQTVGVTLTVASGFYCRCQECGHIWHVEMSLSMRRDTSTIRVRP